MSELELMESYLPEFKAVVLRHVQAVLPESDWKYYRRLARVRQRSSIPWWEDSMLHLDLPELIDKSTTIDRLSIEELLVPAFKANALVIGSIDNQPVWFIDDQGIYAWGKDLQTGLSLSFWATYPAYPPGWA